MHNTYRWMHVSQVYCAYMNIWVYIADGQLGIISSILTVNHGTRTLQNTMTTNPQSVWTKGIIPYQLSPTLRKFQFK